MQEVTKFDTSKLLGKKRDIIPHENILDPKWIKHRDDLTNHRPFRNFEYEMRRPHDGTLLWIRIAGEPQFDAEGTFTGYRGTGHDVTHEKVAMQRLEASNAELAARNEDLNQAKRTIERIAYEDALTTLRNRRAFERDIKGALAHSRGDLGLLHVDLDQFKGVNDTLGHPSGDEVLKITAERLTTVVGNNGDVYRMGGDEFTVILPRATSIDVASWLGDAIVSAMAVPFELETQSVTIGASVGIAIADTNEMSPGQLISHADTALYEAKREGRNTFCCSTPQLQARIEAERCLARDIEEGIERREFLPVFQAQVNAETGMVFGAEALVRWQHPERGLLTPAAFINAAEEMGNIDQIDRLVLEESALVVDRLEQRGIALPGLSVNVSEARLADGHLCNEIERLWRGKACQLTIELLETIDFDEDHGADQFGDILQRLRDMDVRIETDDFGSGRASITGLLRISPDRVKIDRSLIQQVVSCYKKRSLVLGILDMCSALDIDCIAEGIETQADLDAMIALGCSKFQGFLFSRPLQEDAFLQFLRTQKLAPQCDVAQATGLARSA